MMNFLAAAKIPTGSGSGVQRVEGTQVLSGVLDIVYIVAGIIAVIAIVASGLMYVASNGDANRIEAAKNTLLYAVIGLIFVIAAFAVTGFVTGRIR